jgi:hypothetical protein
MILLVRVLVDSEGVVVVEQDDDVGGRELCLMIRLANFFRFDLEKNGVKFYRSTSFIACRFENVSRGGGVTKNPSRNLLRVLSRMLKLGFLFVDKSGVLVFDEKKFDVFVRSRVEGRDWWEYFDNRVTYFK